LGHPGLQWIGAASVAQDVPMMAFVRLQRRLLRAVGARLPLSWLLSTAHLANAIAFAVPFAGSGMASRHGATQGIAERIAETLTARDSRRRRARWRRRATWLATAPS